MSGMKEAVASAIIMVLISGILTDFKLFSVPRIRSLIPDEFNNFSGTRCHVPLDQSVEYINSPDNPTATAFDKSYMKTEFSVIDGSPS